ncbi:MAG: hypothetical protein ACJAZY_002640 [Spirosomataceae bacterium]|jgi:hypothetical protein
MKKNLLLPLTVIAFFSFAFIGCTTYKLSPKDTAWNPYEDGEQFTFFSDKGSGRTFKTSKLRNRKTEQTFIPEIYRS